MPTLYFQCHKCKSPFRTKVKNGEEKGYQVQCHCGQMMTRRKDRDHWPYGNPFENNQEKQDAHDVE